MTCFLRGNTDLTHLLLAFKGISLWIDNDAIIDTMHLHFHKLLLKTTERKKKNQQSNQAHIWQNRMCSYGI